MAPEPDHPITTKLEQARDVLRQIGLPGAQQNDRSAYTLLVLAGLRPDQPWSEVGNPQLGVHQIIERMAHAYGKQYKVGSRETIRRQTLHQFRDAHVVVQNPDGAVPVNSSMNVYQIPASLVVVLRSYGTSRWSSALAGWHETFGWLIERWAAERQQTLVPVTLPDGRTVELSGGGQNPLIRLILNEFAGRFAPGGHVLYLGDAGQKYVVDEKVALADLGIVIDEHGKMPDVLVYLPDRNWLLIVEAVTSHGPISPMRKADLEALFAESSAGLVFVTAFPDRQTWLRPEFDGVRVCGAVL